MRAQRYTAVAITLHWAIAALIVTNILLGWWMHEAVEEAETAAAAIAGYQVHKSIGLTVLVLSLVRLGWRFAHPPPALPEGMPGWEKLAAKATHWAFYVLMIAIPLSGWLYVSAGWSHENERPLEVPTLYFGLFRVPHLFGLENAALGTRAGVADAAIETHALLVWSAIALVVLHVGAALKHWLIDRDDVTPNMLPVLPILRSGETLARGDRRRWIVYGAGVVLAVLIASGAASVFRAGGTASRAPAAGEHADSSGPGSAEEQAAANPSAQAPGAHASARWIVDHANSSIRFSGTHAGAAFEGRFSRWRAEIAFDPNDLERASAVVTVETASAADGVAMHDQALPGAEWFNAAAHPTAVFRAERFRHRDGNNYEARGTLTIKGKAIDIDLPFTLSIDGDTATMQGRTEIDRREADLGMTSDPDAEYVSREIVVIVRVTARRGS